MNTPATYTTRDEAIQREIVDVLGPYNTQRHDIEAIANDVLTTTGEGTHYRWTLDTNKDFWIYVASHQLPASSD